MNRRDLLNDPGSLSNDLIRMINAGWLVAAVPVARRSENGFQNRMGGFTLDR
jgi:hypothetical protein